MILLGEEVKSDCLFFKGDVPCTPHKEHGVHCKECTHYTKRIGRILIIKLGATGDVIRTTVLLPAIRSTYPDHEIWWVTNSPEIVPTTVHKRLKYSLESIQTLESISFDMVINLDKDLHACALTSKIDARVVYGFVLNDGIPAPANAAAEHKLLTGIFDDANKANTASYSHEILELCGFEYQQQEYEIDTAGPPPFDMPAGKHVVGLNTGCGDRWIAREWPIEHWLSLIEMLQQGGYGVVLLGGPEEHKRNTMLSADTNALYNGTFPLREFSNIVNACDIVVTTVTMALHLAIAHKTQVVLMNNIFNKHEFELYDRGILVEPPIQCTCFYQHQCTNLNDSCMIQLQPSTIFAAIELRTLHL